MNPTTTRRVYNYLFLLSLISSVFAATPALAARTPSVPETWNVLEHYVRDKMVPQAKAQEEMRRLRPLLDKYFLENKGIISPYTGVFPVSGYDIFDAGVKGYLPRGYDFFSGTKHGAHPAVDIFIRDRNHDCLDDRTRRPVDVLSMSPGIVTAVNTGWEPGGGIRGGNYVWVYDPVTKGLFYYAHMKQVFVEPGRMVYPGNALGTIGRTGKNAYPRRSPTHLHVMYMRYPENGYPFPENVAKMLVSAARHKITAAAGGK